MYHERQRLMYCGIHAVNNVAQRATMQKKDFDVSSCVHAFALRPYVRTCAHGPAFASHVDAYACVQGICVSLVRQSCQRSWVNPHRSVFGVGNYDVRADRPIPSSPLVPTICALGAAT